MHKDAPYQNSGQSRPSNDHYVLLHEWKEQNNSRNFNNDNNQKREPPDKTQLMEQLFERQTKNLNKGFDRSNESITTLVNLMGSGGRLPA